MKKYSVLKLFVILFLSVGLKNAHASCDAYASIPTISTKIDYGRIYYDNTKSNSEFPSKPYATTMGLTVSDLKENMDTSVEVFPQEDGTFCVVLKQVNTYIGFPRVDVYIDKKYKPGSCNYNVIKAHENYHVRVQQEGLQFFEPKIKKAIRIAVRKVKPVRIRSIDQVNSTASAMLSQIQKDFAPTMNFVKKRLYEENMVIDTPKSYEAETKKCKKW